MIVMGVAGYKNAGKTQLIERLIGAAGARGLRVSTVKRTHHGVDLERPGTDTARHRDAGAAEVILASDARFALLSERPSTLPELLSRLTPVDLALVEGFKAADHPRVEVWRASLGHPLMALSDPRVRAVVSDDAPDVRLPVLGFADIGAILDTVLAEGAHSVRPVP